MICDCWRVFDLLGYSSHCGLETCSTVSMSVCFPAGTPLNAGREARLARDIWKIPGDLIYVRHGTTLEKEGSLEWKESEVASHTHLWMLGWPDGSVVKTVRQHALMDIYCLRIILWAARLSESVLKNWLASTECRHQSTFPSTCCVFLPSMLLKRSLGAARRQIMLCFLNIFSEACQTLCFPSYDTCSMENDIQMRLFKIQLN